MGDYENRPVIVRPPTVTIQQAVSKAVASFDTSSLDGKFTMTISEGHRVFMAMHRVFKALENLEKAAGSIPSSY